MREQYKDIGVVDWYNTEKGYGNIVSLTYGNVFIHKSGVKDALSKGNIVFIERILKKNDRIEGVGVCKVVDYRIVVDDLINNISQEEYFFGQKNVRFLLKYFCNEDVIQKLFECKKKFGGLDLSFVKDFQSKCPSLSMNSGLLCNYIYDYWLENGNKTFDVNIKWLLKTCNCSFLKGLINDNINIWIQCELFVSTLRERKEKLKFDSIDGDIVDLFIADYWRKNGRGICDDNLKCLLNYGSLPREELLMILKESCDSLFVNDFFVSFRNKKIIIEFLLGELSNGKYNGFNLIVKWLLDNADQKTIENVLLNKNVSFNEEFVSYLRETRGKYKSEMICEFFVVLVDENRILFDLKRDIIWIINNCLTEVLYKYLECFYLAYNTGMLSLIFELISRTNTESLRISIIEKFIFNIWLHNGSFEFDENVRWIIKNGNGDTLKFVIDLDKAKWLNNSLFAEYLRENHNNSNKYLVCRFLFDFCDSKNLQVEIKTLIWLLQESDYNGIKYLLSRSLKYEDKVLDKIYFALFPNQNSNYFKNKAYRTDWSDDYKDKYVKDKYEKIRLNYVNLFVREIEVNNLNPVRILRFNPYSATALANFTYCPVSYVLSQTYDLDFSEQENIRIGRKEHEKRRLLNISQKASIKHQFFISDDISRIFNSECLYSGHESLNAKIFYSKKGVLSSSPDYIFKDAKGIFVVEEKYTLKGIDEVTNVYDNHKTQALVYLYGISDFDIKEVYLIYWFVKAEDNYFNEWNESIDWCVKGYKVFKFKKSDENEKYLLKVFNEVQSIQNREPYKDFSPNYNKCVKCNYFPYCKYKKGQSDVLQLPPLNE